MSDKVKNHLVPKETYFGWGAIQQLEKIKGAKAIIVTGVESMRRAGFLQSAADYLTSAGLRVEIIGGVRPDPTRESVLDGAKTLTNFAPDWIVGLGGCSAIDAAKAMWVCYEHPELSFDEIVVPFNVPPLRDKARFVAVPSTSGTGTEMSYAAVITNKTLGTKQTIVSPEILPDIAILDPALTLTMSPEVTANTGIDALTHSIEAYVSTDHSPFTDAVALEATRLISIYLPRAYTNGDDREAREQMHYASALAGIAQSNAVLGICHSLAHQLGGMFGITHGVANTILLPHVIRFNSSATDRYDRLAQSMNLKDVDGLVEHIIKLANSLNVPTTLEKVGISQAELNANLSAMSDHAVKDDCTLTNPRPTSREDMQSILMQALR